MRDGAMFKVKSKHDRFCVLKRVRAAACDCLELPKYCDGMYIEEIGSGAFKGGAFKTVIIPDSVKRLAPKAFCGSDIEYIVVPETVEFIGKAAFRDCVNLRSVVIKNANAVIQPKIFDKCYHIAQADVPISVASKAAFPRIAELTVSGAGRIEKSAFEDCKSLKRVTLGGGITEIGESAFDCCDALEEVVFADGLRRIESDAFAYCTALGAVELPETVEEICAGAFCDSGIKTMSVAAGNKVYHSADNCVIRTADKRLVAGCSYSVIPNDGSVTTIGERAFESCDEMTAVEIPDRITELCANAFAWCDGLIEANLHEGVERVGDWAFEECTALETVILPASLAYLGLSVFDGCENLSEVCYNGTMAQWESLDKDAYWNSALIETVHCSDGDIKL